MVAKLLAALSVGVFSLTCAAQAVPDLYHPTLATSAGFGMNYWSGDWAGNINRWGPSAWTTVTVWHDLNVYVEGHSMVIGGGQEGPSYKYFAGGGGPEYISDYWGRFQPILKGEIGYASLTHPTNGTGHLHHSSYIWSAGGGVEYHTWGNLWTRVEYSYDFFPNFHSSATGQNHTLNPHGFTIGETFRFGPTGSRF